MGRANNFAFIDGANLHFTYENLSRKLDYQKLRNYLKKKLDVVVAYYFIGNLKEYEDIYTTLETYDYTLKLKDPSPYTTKEEYCPYCHGSGVDLDGRYIVFKGMPALRKLLKPKSHCETKRNKGDNHE